MQNAFCHSEGFFARSGAPPIIDLPNCIAEISALLVAARRLEIAVLYTRHVYKEDLSDADSVTRRLFRSDSRLLARGSWDAEIIDELFPASSEIVVEKNRYDAFLHTGLENLLQQRGITSLVVCGVLTNVCVAITATAAYMRDFSIAVPSDCTAALDSDLKAAYLKSMGAFADIRPWAELCLHP
jgi:ureidoacrylate peracid hydrolase